MEIEANLIPRGINLVSLQNYFVDRLYNLITPQIEMCVRVYACVRARVLREGTNRVHKQSINCVQREEREGRKTATNKEEN